MSRAAVSLMILCCFAVGCSDVRSMRRARDVEGLIRVLSDPDPHIRVKAVDALGYVGDSRAVRPLIERLEDSDSYVREHAARNLGCDYHSSLGCDTGAPIQPLLEVLDDEDAFVRVEAVRSLGEHPLPVSREPLERLARTDPRWEVRHAAAYALGRIGSPESIEVLEALVAGENEQVASMAQESLRRISTARELGRRRSGDVEVEVTTDSSDVDGGVDGGVDGFERDAS